MFHTLCGVADFGVPEIGPHLFGAALGTPQVTPHVSHHLRLVAWTPSANCVCLDILIEQLVRIEIRAVAGQKKEANLPPLARQPSFESGGRMYWMPVDNEKDFSSSMTDQPLQEHNKYEDREILVEYHECHLAAVGDSGDHVAAETFSSPWDDRCLSTPPVGSACLMVGPHPHLVAPVNRCALSSCASPDGRILLRQPLPHRLGVPLVCPPQGFLGREAPALEVTPYRPDGKLDVESAGDEIPNRFARPEGKRQLELVRTTVGNQTDGRSGLPRSQSNDGGSSSRTRPQCPNPAFSTASMPTVDRPSRHPKDTSRLCLGHSPADSPNDTFAQRVLRFWRQTPRVDMLHTTRKYSIGGST